MYIIYNVFFHVNEFGLLYDAMCIYKYLYINIYNINIYNINIYNI